MWSSLMKIYNCRKTNDEKIYEELTDFCEGFERKLFMIFEEKLAWILLLSELDDKILKLGFRNS